MAGDIDDREAEEAQPGKKARAPRKNRTRINRDQGEIPVVQDETGERVTDLFQHFLEK